MLREARIETITDTPEKVVSVFRAPQPIGGPGRAIDADAVFILARAANDCGFARSLTKNATARQLTESSISVFQSRPELVVSAEAKPVFVQPKSATWRARIFVGDDVSFDTRNLVAEVTETQVLFADDLKQAKSVQAAKADEPATNRRQATEGPRALLQERLAQIAAGALDVISKKGFGSASIREIAAAAGMPIPTMYLYIKRKEDILFLLSNRYLGELTHEFELALRKPGPAKPLLQSAIKRYLDYCSTHRKLINVVYRDAKWLPADDRQKIFDLDRAFVAAWEGILARGAESGEFRIDNIPLTANYIYFLCTSWAIRHWTLGQFGENEVRKSMLDFILRAIKIGEVSRPAKSTRSVKTK